MARGPSVTLAWVSLAAGGFLSRNKTHGVYLTSLGLDGRKAGQSFKYYVEID